MTINKEYIVLKIIGVLLSCVLLFWALFIGFNGGVALLGGLFLILFIAYIIGDASNYRKPRRTMVDPP